MLQKIVDACRFLLNNYPEAQDCKSYLDSRLSQASQDVFQFGYFPRINNMSVLIDLVGKEALLANGLLTTWNIEDSLAPRQALRNYFEHHPLIMPFRNPYGEAAGLVARSILSSEEMQAKDISKYKNTTESKLFKKSFLVFGLYENKQSILEQDCVYVVEGQFDVIKANEIGFKNIVAIGSNNMSPYQFSVISRYTNNIFLLLDNDDAGQKGRKRIISKYGELANIRDFYLPNEYKDIDEYLTKSKVGSYDEISFSVKG